MKPKVPTRLPPVADWRAELRRARRGMLVFWAFALPFLVLCLWSEEATFPDPWPLYAMALMLICLSLWTGRLRSGRDYRAAGLIGGDRSVIASYPAIVQKGLLQAVEAGASEDDLMPPGYRVLWRLGIPVAPPAFAGFLTRFLVLYGTVFVLLPLWMVIDAWTWDVENKVAMITWGLALLAIIVAVLSAIEAQRKQLVGLPSWREFRRMHG
ncbi:DUF6404 family protein [Luteimonas lutimaris]|uniref:Sensor domain-containing protein n=1 Tax=Luteimonas lutimaris TaxID=698645 RepID=A0ABP7MCZ4_9GAMM|nr:DUF6404 family protein [Luteimonas sp.]